MAGGGSDPRRGFLTWQVEDLILGAARNGTSAPPALEQTPPDRTALDRAAGAGDGSGAGGGAGPVASSPVAVAPSASATRAALQVRVQRLENALASAVDLLQEQLGQLGHEHDAVDEQQAEPELPAEAGLPSASGLCRLHADGASATALSSLDA